MRMAYLPWLKPSPDQPSMRRSTRRRQDWMWQRRRDITAQRHRSGYRRGRAPYVAAIERGNESHVERAGGSSAVRLRIVVISESQMGRGAAGCGINAEPGNKVINCTGERINRGARRHGPTYTIRRSAHYQVIRRAVGSKTAILPHHINIACGVYRRGR